MDKIGGSISTIGEISGKLSTTDEVDGSLQTERGVFGSVGRTNNNDYAALENLPKIENVVLAGNKNLSDFGDRNMTNTEIQSIINKVFD